MLKRKFHAGVIINCLLFIVLCSFISYKDLQPLQQGLVQDMVDTSGVDNTDRFTSIEIVEKKTMDFSVNKNAEKFVRDYIKKNGFFIGKTKNRVAPYFAIIDSVFESHGLPVELKYLAYIESGFKPNLVSRSGAIGPWAFMPAAAKQYGLRISKPHDERLDYYKSTKAAAGLLCDLYSKYGDWLLVIAAYNCGPAYVQKAIKCTRSRNYCTLQNYLPKETRSHVKKFIAVHRYFEMDSSLLLSLNKGSDF